MKKLSSLLFALVASTSMLFAENGTCGENLTWDLTDSVLTIRGTGAMTDYVRETNVPWYALRMSIKSIVIMDGVSTIGREAFDGSMNLISVIIHSSVTTIGNKAFYRCTGLTSVTIPNGVTSIGSSAFSSCSGLTSVTIPNSVTNIGSSAFYGCTGLTSVTIPNGVTSIGSSAFSSCSGLTSIEIPNSVTSIGSSAFSNCTDLTSVTIGNSVTSIGGGAFEGCTSLTSVAIPNSVTSIGNYAFSGCTGLTSVILNSNTIVSKIYESSSTLGSKFGTQVKEYIIGDSVTSIGDYAFYNCSNLTSVTLSSSITSIGWQAFKECRNLSAHISDLTAWLNIDFGGGSANPVCDGQDLYINGELLTDLVIPEGITQINKNAFYGYQKLSSVEMHRTINTIGENAFRNCTGLMSIYNYRERPCLVSENAFYGVNKFDCTLYVPEGSVDMYKSEGSGWKDFYYILPMESPEAIENTAANTQNSVVKLFRDGQILILRGEKVFTLQGQEVK